MVAREGALNSHSVAEEATNAVVSPGEPSRSEEVDLDNGLNRDA